jgi:hypothetical protein
MVNALQVICATPGACHRPHGFFGIILAIADPGQINLSCFDQNSAD